MHASVCPLLWWLYDDDTVWCMPSLLQKFSSFSDMKFVPASKATYLGSPYSDKIIFYIFLDIHAESLHLLDDGEFALVIYDTNILLFIYCKDVSLYRFPQSSWYIYVIMLCP